MSTDADYEQRLADRKARLAEMNYDGPYRFVTALDFSTLFGSWRDEFAICLQCGAVVILNDPEVGADGEAAVERSVRIHADWHGKLGGVA